MRDMTSRGLLKWKLKMHITLENRLYLNFRKMEGTMEKIGYYYYFVKQ